MQNFDDHPYYPAIRTRPAELTGYRKLSDEQKDRLLPLVTLGSWPRQDGVDASMAETEQALDGRPYMLDLTREATYQLSEIRGLLDDSDDFNAWRKFIKKFENAIPVIQMREAKIPRITRQARAFVEAGRKVAFRIVDFRSDTPKVAAALAALPSTDSALVIIDAGYIRDSFEAVSIACADVINEIREDIDDAIITLISSSFPASVVSLADPDSGGQRGLISMLERPLHEGLGGTTSASMGITAQFMQESIQLQAAGTRAESTILFTMDGRSSDGRTANRTATSIALGHLLKRIPRLRMTLHGGLAQLSARPKATSMA